MKDNNVGLLLALLIAYCVRK